MLKVDVNWTIKPDILKKMSHEAMEKGIKDTLEVVLQQANQKVPLDKSTLLKSGNTDVSSQNGNIKGSVYYDTPYAIKLHEHPEYQFQRGREGKWLENTAKEANHILELNLANELKKTFGG